MASLTSLSNAILVMIFKNFDRMETLSSALRVCRRLHAAFHADSGVLEAIIYRQIPPTVLPYAVVWEEARCLPSDPVDTSILTMMDQINTHPDLLIAQAFKFPVARLVKMSRTHDMIHGFVMHYAQRAKACINPKSYDPVVLSPTEYMRFCRAFYRLDLCNLLHVLFGYGPTVEQRLYHAYFPWENEQVASVLEYLKDRFRLATYEAMAHDVELGARTFHVSYYLTDYMIRADHGWSIYYPQAKFITEMVHSLEQDESYEAVCRILRPMRPGPLASWRKSNLKLGLRRSTIAFWPKVNENPTTWPSNAGVIKLRKVPKEDMFQHILTTCTWTQDEETRRCLRTPTTADAADPADKDSFRSWRKLHANRTIPKTVFRRGHDSELRRERAYLFWDYERARLITHKNFVFVWFHDTAATAISKESWKERAWIWEQGGSGYWSEGDMSRVVWGRRG